MTCPHGLSADGLQVSNGKMGSFFFFLLSKVGIFDEEVFLRSFVEGANTCAVVILLWVPKRVEFCGDVLGTMARAQAMRQ